MNHADCVLDEVALVPDHEWLATGLHVREWRVQILFLLRRNERLASVRARHTRRREQRAGGQDV